jgi:predicted DNA-binding transcriptional regulator AlpA
MAIDHLKLLRAEDLAALLGRAPSTIKSDVRRRPETLPPRFQVPGTNRLRWLEADVVEWVAKQRELSKQGR